MIDWIDKILIHNAKKHMMQFEIGKFKRDFPSLYHTIRASIYESRFGKD